MTKPRAKPYDPNAAMRRRLEADSVEWFDRLVANPSIRIAADAGDNIKAIKRRSVFEMLLSRKSITQDHHNAIDRLWDDLAIARHEADRSPLVAVTGSWATQGPIDRALAAQDRCMLVAAHVGPRSWLLLRELVTNELRGGTPENGERVREPWRAIVRMATGEDDETSQATCVRWACSELVTAYTAIDNSPPVERPRARLAGGA